MMGGPRRGGRTTHKFHICEGARSLQCVALPAVRKEAAWKQAPLCLSPHLCGRVVLQVIRGTGFGCPSATIQPPAASSAAAAAPLLPPLLGCQALLREALQPHTPEFKVEGEREGA